jgi:hypothetical protein
MIEDQAVERIFLRCMPFGLEMNRLGRLGLDERGPLAIAAIDLYKQRVRFQVCEVLRAELQGVHDALDERDPTRTRLVTRMNELIAARDSQPDAPDPIIGSSR